MPKTIFYCGESQPHSTYCCRVGASRSGTWNPGGSPPSDPSDIDYWATGTLIHGKVIMTVAHAPRSRMIMGDRVLLPAIGTPPTDPKYGKDGSVYFPERILRVRRIIDHPDVRRPHDDREQPEIDVRFLLLHVDDYGPDVLYELERRRAHLARLEPSPTEFGLCGFERQGNEQRPPSYVSRHRKARVADDPNSSETHGHNLATEFVIQPQNSAQGVVQDSKAITQPADRKELSADFGDSGAPVSVGSVKDEKVVGLYVRRSINRPTSDDPALVVVRIECALNERARILLARHGVDVTVEMKDFSVAAA